MANKKMGEKLRNAGFHVSMLGILYMIVISFVVSGFMTAIMGVTFNERWVETMRDYSYVIIGWLINRNMVKKEEHTNGKS
jgi:hypothetical protein